MARGNYKKVTEADIKELSGKAKMLNIVYKEFKGNDERVGLIHLAGKIGVSVRTLHNQITGRTPVSQKVTDGILHELGYSAEWWHNETGPRKKGKSDETDSTDIEMLRVDIKQLRLDLHREKALRKADIDRLEELINNMNLRLTNH